MAMSPADVGQEFRDNLDTAMANTSKECIGWMLLKWSEGNSAWQVHATDYIGTSVSIGIGDELMDADGNTYTASSGLPTVTTSPALPVPEDNAKMIGVAVFKDKPNISWDDSKVKATSVTNNLFSPIIAHMKANAVGNYNWATKLNSCLCTAIVPPANNGSYLGFVAMASEGTISGMSASTLADEIRTAISNVGGSDLELVVNWVGAGYWDEANSAFICDLSASYGQILIGDKLVNEDGDSYEVIQTPFGSGQSQAVRVNGDISGVGPNDSFWVVRTTPSVDFSQGNATAIIDGIATAFVDHIHNYARMTTSVIAINNTVAATVIQGPLGYTASATIDSISASTLASAMRAQINLATTGQLNPNQMQNRTFVAQGWAAGSWDETAQAFHMKLSKWDGAFTVGVDAGPSNYQEADKFIETESEDEHNFVSQPNTVDGTPLVTASPSLSNYTGKTALLVERHHFKVDEGANYAQDYINELATAIVDHITSNATVDMSFSLTGLTCPATGASPTPPTQADITDGDVD